MSPLVSVITPLYNALPYFKETAISVLSQTFTNYEWIIVDDCSADESYEAAKELAKKDNRIVLLQAEANGGSAKARNIALGKARGKYITFLDSDDLLDPNYLERQVAFIEQNGPIITASYRRKTDLSVTEFHVPSETTYQSILKGNPLSCLTTMYERAAFPDARFPEDMLRHEDYVFWANMLKTGVKATGNPEVLATYRLLPHSKNRSKAKLIKPMVDVYHKKFGFGLIRSWFYTARYVMYSRKKYKGVR